MTVGFGDKTAHRRRNAIAATLAAALATIPVSASAADEWSGSATVYGWLTWMDIKTTPDNGNGSVDTSLSLSDILDALNFTFMASGDLHYGRIGLLQDLVYSDLGFGGRLDGPFASKVDIENKMLLWTSALGYQVYNENGTIIEPYAGVRYVNTKMDLKIKGGGPLGNKVSGFVDVDWWDPVIGAKGRTPLTEKLSATAFADIGGFGVGSKFTWEIYGGLDYAFNQTVSANAGFRYMYINYEGSSADTKLELYGPQLGLTLRF